MTLSTAQAKIRYLLGELTSSTYSDTDINRAINNYYNKSVALAMEKMGKWDVNGELAVTDLVASQQDYSLPLDLLYLSRIEANFTGGTQTWSRIDSLDEREYSPAISNNTTNGIPSWFNLVDNSIFFNVPVETSVTGGLKIWYTSEVTALSGSSDVISIPEHVIDYIIYGACLEYAIRTNDNDGFTKFTRLITENAESIKRY